MRVNTDQSYVNRTNAATESIRMSFDENSIGFLMDVMTNLYSDTAGAPIREYPSNALDSHKEAGVTRPVEVRLPTLFNKRFEVQDFGLGMSPDDITKIYSKYGYSTKRNDDVAVGMLGLGSKSGLTYTDQFSVIAIKGGVKTMATVARGTDGAGTINILDTSTTDEGNGVTISIPVHDVHEFRRKAQNFFRWWEPGTVLIDGETPVYPDADTLKVDDDIIVHKNHSIPEDYVVMGCIAYPVGSRLSEGLPYGFRVVAYVPMGAVNFPPNRESLQYTARTNAVIKDIVERRAAGIKAAAESDIKNAATYTDAIRAVKTWRNLLGGVKPEYKGKEIPQYISGATRTDGTTGSFYFYDGGRYRNRLSALGRIEAERFAELVVVKGFDNKNLSTQNRKKIKVYFDQQSIDADSYIVTDDMLGGDWADGVTTVEWEEIKQIRFSTGGRKASTARETFDVYKNGEGFKTVDEVDADDIVLVSPAWVNQSQRDTIHISTIANALPEATLVLLSKNRWGKFERENDNVRTLDDALTARAKEFSAELSDFQYTDVQGRGYSFEPFKSMDASKVEDPDVKTLIRQMGDNRSRKSEWTDILRSYNVVTDHYGTLELVERTVQFENVLDKYPFVQYARRVENEHVYHYMNLVHRDGKGNK